METIKIITFEEFMMDDLVQEYYPNIFPKQVFKECLHNRSIMQVNLDEICSMTLEELTKLADSYTAVALDADEAPQDEDTLEEEVSDDGIQISVDDMGVTARIMLHRRAGLSAPGEAELRSALVKKKIICGLKMPVLTRLSERAIYNRFFKIATGRLPVDGDDGQVIFHFSREIDLAPRIGEDGTADYKELDYVQNVKEGSILCDIIAPTKGRNGVNVFGKIIPSKPGNEATVKCGENTVLSKDQHHILAACDGQVHYKNGEVIVSRVLLLDRVDNATGNISFVGTVKIKGDVASGFSVHAGGDIIVGGVVEDASLFAGGNIILCSGIKGSDGGLLDTSGTVRTLFIESARVKAGGDIYADSILNSQIECGRSVYVMGINGCLRGGSCLAGGTVKAVTIGNNAHVQTVISLKSGWSPDVYTDDEQRKSELYREGLVKLEQAASFARESAEEEDDFKLILAGIVITRCRIRQKLQALVKEETAQEQKIIAQGCVYPNVQIDIDDVHHTITDIRKACMIYYSKGHLKASAIYKYGEESEQ